MATDNIKAINVYLNNIGNILRLKNNTIDPNSPFKFLDIPDKDKGLNVDANYNNYFIKKFTDQNQFSEEILFKYILFKNMENLQNLTSVNRMYYYQFVMSDNYVRYELLLRTLIKLYNSGASSFSYTAVPNNNIDLSVGASTALLNALYLNPATTTFKTADTSKGSGNKITENEAKFTGAGNIPSSSNRYYNQITIGQAFFTIIRDHYLYKKRILEENIEDPNNNFLDEIKKLYHIALFNLLEMKNLILTDKNLGDSNLKISVSNDATNANIRNINPLPYYNSIVIPNYNYNLYDNYGNYKGIINHINGVKGEYVKYTFKNAIEINRITISFGKWWSGRPRYVYIYGTDIAEADINKISDVIKALKEAQTAIIYRNNNYTNAAKAVNAATAANTAISNVNSAINVIGSSYIAANAAKLAITNANNAINTAALAAATAARTDATEDNKTAANTAASTAKSDADAATTATNNINSAILDYENTTIKALKGGITISNHYSVYTLTSGIPFNNPTPYKTYILLFTGINPARELVITNIELSKDGYITLVNNNLLGITGGTSTNYINTLLFDHDYIGENSTNKSLSSYINPPVTTSTVNIDNFNKLEKNNQNKILLENDISNLSKQNTKYKSTKDLDKNKIVYISYLEIYCIILLVFTFILGSVLVMNNTNDSSMSYLLSLFILIVVLISYYIIIYSNMIINNLYENFGDTYSANPEHTSATYYSDNLFPNFDNILNSLTLKRTLGISNSYFDKNNRNSSNDKKRLEYSLYNNKNSVNDNNIEYRKKKNQIILINNIALLIAISVFIYISYPKLKLYILIIASIIFCILLCFYFYNLIRISRKDYNKVYNNLLTSRIYKL